MTGAPFDYVLKRSRRRTIGFRIDHGGLTVTAPHGVSQRVIDGAVLEKSGWIRSKLAEWAARPAPMTLDYVDGETLPVFGEDVRLEILGRGVRTRVSRREDVLQVSVDPQIEGALRTAAIRGGLERWARREGLAYMEPKTRAYAQMIGRKPAKITVREQKSRWGSCASDGSIRLNWRLIGFPAPLIDYVCAHEAAHLVEPNHAPAFWAVVEGLAPDWKEKRRAMRDQAERWRWP